MGLLPKEKEIPEDVGDPKLGWATEVGYNQALADVRAILEKVEVDNSKVEELFYGYEQIVFEGRNVVAIHPDEIAHTLSQAEGLLKGIQ